MITNTPASNIPVNFAIDWTSTTDTNPTDEIILDPIANEPENE